jgi:hypothetical protein
MNERELGRLLRRIAGTVAAVSASSGMAACGGTTDAPRSGDAADATPGAPDGNGPDDASTAPRTAVTSCGEVVTINTGGPFSPSIVDGQVVGCGIAQCSPWDGGPVDASGIDCPSACGSAPDSCTTVEDGGVVLLRCQPPLCLGRRPEGLCAAEAAPPASLGARFAEMARLEAASVGAFHRLRRELVAHGAPRRLVRGAERAARDETRHARTTGALARRQGFAAVAPRVGAWPERGLEAMAIENAVEGCVRETFGALVAMWQSRAAADPLVRAAMKRIARDETRHAALAFAVDSWASGRLDRAARARVEQKKSEALAELAGGAGAPDALQGVLGLPSPGDSRALLEGMAGALRPRPMRRERARR